MRLYTVYYISVICSTCFVWYPHPSSGAHINVFYSIWHRSGHFCYFPLSWRIWNCSANSSTIAEGSRNGLTSARCCKIQLHALLMMGGGTTQNMQSRLQKYNKLYIVASCSTIIDIDSRCTNPWTLKKKVSVIPLISTIFYMIHNNALIIEYEKYDQ